MTEKIKSINDSFNEEFCIQLEYKISNAFSNSNNNELKYLWCDGVSWAPYYNSEANKDYLNYDKVKERKEIKTISWIGEDGQGQYEMIIKLGKSSIDIKTKKT